MNTTEFHPIRWVDEHPDHRRMLRWAHDVRSRLADGDRDAGQEFEDAAQHLLSRSLAAQREYQDPVKFTKLLKNGCANSMRIAQFIDAGRNIVVVPGLVAEYLDGASLDGLTIADVPCTFPAAYIAFEDSPFDGSDIAGVRAKIEGAYVLFGRRDPESEDKGRWDWATIYCVTRPNARAAWPASITDAISFRIDASSPEASLAEEIDRSSNLLVEQARAAMTRRTSGTASDHAMNMSDFHEAVRARDFENLYVHGAKQAKRALATVFHTLCMLAAMPEEVDRAYDDRISPRLRADLSSDHPATKTRAETEMRHRDMPNVFVVGARIDPGPSAGFGSDTSRRGRWMQQHGVPGVRLVPDAHDPDEPGSGFGMI
jgi:hypothetical protein